MNKIDENAKFTNVYHLIAASCEAFGRITPNINNKMQEIVQHMYGRYDTALENVHRAANEYDIHTKLLCLETAQSALFYQHNSLELLVKSRAISVGTANEVIATLKKAHEETKKWLNYTRKMPGANAKGS